MGQIWTPPGADLGEADGPEPDSRMKHFIGGFDADERPLAMTYRRMRAAADEWLITNATPEGPASLLKTARDMFALGFYSYELVAASNTWSLFAVEAALKLRFDAPERTGFEKLIGLAKDAGVLDDAVAEHIHDGRKLRNNFVHAGRQAAWTLGMAGGLIGASFELVARLFPDVTEPQIP